MPPEVSGSVDVGMTDALMIFSIAWTVAFAVGALVYWKHRQWGKLGLFILVPLFCLTLVGLWPLLFNADDLAGTSSAEGTPTGENGTVPITPAVFEPFRPLEVTSDGYVKASACLECHEQNYHSWHDSYHRTMTQLATADSVMGDFSGKTVSFDGRDYRMTQEGDLCWVELPTSIVQSEGPPVSPNETSRLPVVMSTGSHHMQVYWFPMGKGRMLGQFPLVYLKEADRWVPRKSCFLEPPTSDADIEIGRWNNTCLQCHTTNPKQKLSRDFVFDTKVAEFGISCEACHGPGEKHIAFHRTTQDPSGLVERQSSVSDTVASDAESGNPDLQNQVDPIVNPRDLDHRLSSQVCGNCHAMATHLDPKTRNDGHTFRPGKSLSDSRHVYRCNPSSESLLKKQGQDPKAFFESVFWKDGMIRVSGREFNGLADSPCYQKGTMSCLSCHAVHKEDGDSRSTADWANDQLAIDMDGDHACTQCHDAADYGERHTHHDLAGSGSRCYNCHMPHTTYGLMKAMRSHQISSPDVGRDQQAERPNACNLCHLDQPLSWTADKLESWYGIEKPILDEAESNLATGVLWSLQGDAGIRAIVAWHMGWKPAMQASQADWMARYLTHLLTDPYDVVRYIAGRSLKAIQGFEDLDYDYVAAIKDRLAAQTAAVMRWDELHDGDSSTGDHLLVDPEGELLLQKFRDLAGQRNDRDMFLNE